MATPAAVSLLDNVQYLESEEVTILQCLESGSPYSVAEIAAHGYALPSRVHKALDHLSELGFVEADASDTTVFRISQGGQAALSICLFEAGEKTESYK